MGESHLGGSYGPHNSLNASLESGKVDKSFLNRRPQSMLESRAKLQRILLFRQISACKSHDSSYIPDV